MIVPITLIASTRPDRHVLRHLTDPATALIADRSTASAIGASGLIARGRVTLTEPDTYFRSPGCECCAVREDLVHAVVRALRQVDPPARLVLVVDTEANDLLTVVSTILSSVDIHRRCSLDGVIAHVDAVELSTRLATDAPLLDSGASTTLSISDRIVLDGSRRVTAQSLATLRSALVRRAGFATFVDGDVDRGDLGVLDAWHGAPAAVPIEGGTDHDHPTTIVLRVDEPLDGDAIEGWLDLVVARHASRILRLQGALSVVGNDERTCCFGVRSFATSHSEREHRRKRSSASVLAICGVGLDADELTAGFRATVAT